MNNTFDTWMSKQDQGNLSAALEEATPSITRRITDPKAAFTFLTAGDATFTLLSQKTGTRYTFKVTAIKDSKNKFFVGMLTGSDNNSDYSYIGLIEGTTFRRTPKSKMSADSAPVKAISYTVTHLAANHMPQQLEFWHEGRCGRCGRKLTVPASIELGIGPECASKMGGAL